MLSVGLISATLSSQITHILGESYIDGLAEIPGAAQAVLCELTIYMHKVKTYTHESLDIDLNIGMSGIMLRWRCFLST